MKSSVVDGTNVPFTCSPVVFTKLVIRDPVSDGLDMINVFVIGLKV